MLDPDHNYFELFGLAPAFDIDVPRLAIRYRELQQVVHPDRYAGGSDRERRLSLQATTRLNEAFETLKSPLARGRYLLELKTGRAPADGGSIDDPEFLMQQMELREALDEARRAKDPLQAVGRLIDEIGAALRGLERELSEGFATGDAAGLERVRRGLYRLQFLSRLRAEAERVEATLEDH